VITTSVLKLLVVKLLAAYVPCFARGRVALLI
jgi:hypothetical protein